MAHSAAMALVLGKDGGAEESAVHENVLSLIWTKGDEPSNPPLHHFVALLGTSEKRIPLRLDLFSRLHTTAGGKQMLHGQVR